MGLGSRVVGLWFRGSGWSVCGFRVYGGRFVGLGVRVVGLWV